MCHYVILVAAATDDQALDTAMRAHGRRAARVENASLAKVLAPGERQYVTTAGHCDCGTVFARGRELSEDEVIAEHEKKQRQLAKRGWSSAKIERWFEDSDRAKARPGGGIDSIELWTAVLSDLLGALGLKAAGLFTHAYHGAITTEVFVAKRSVVRLGPDLRDRLNTLKEDELLIVHS